MASKTQMFRDQHKDLVDMVGQLKPALDVAKLAKDGSAARSLLIGLAGKLNVHLSMEDKSLYPQLLKHQDSSVQAKAKTFMTQMGGIKEAFLAFLGKYPTPQAIQTSAAAFVADTQGIIQVLAKRIDAENSDLYALVDRLG